MPFQLSLYHSSQRTNTSIFNSLIPDILVNTDNSQGFLIQGIIEYEYEGVIYSYMPNSTLIMTTDHQNKDFSYYQKLIPVDDKGIKTPRIYARGTLYGNGVAVTVITPNDTEGIECFISTLPKSKHDSIYIKERCYQCERVVISKNGIKIYTGVYNVDLQTWMDWLTGA